MIKKPNFFKRHIQITDTPAVPKSLPDFFMPNLHKGIESEGRLVHYPRGLSDEEKAELRRQYEAEGYEVVEINQIQNNKTQHDT